MRAYNPPTAQYFASRSGYIGHLLLWVSARHRVNGNIENIGFWTGADHQDFSIDGQSRLYFAAGTLLSADPLRRQTGIKVRTHAS